MKYYLMYQNGSSIEQVGEYYTKADAERAKASFLEYRQSMSDYNPMLESYYII